MTEITLPELGETVTEGTITDWFKQVGDTVTEGEALLEVSTDKVDSEVPSPTSGVIQQIVANIGDTIAVGAVIAIVGDTAATTTPEPAPAEPAPAPAAAPTPEPAAPAPAAAATAVDQPATASGTDIVLPELGETVTEGTITDWFKQVGDTVTEGEALLEVSTDKVDSEVPSPTSGVIQQIVANIGDTIAVGAVIAIVGDTAAAATPEPAPAPAEPAPAPAAAPAPAPAAAAPAANLPESVVAPTGEAPEGAPLLAPLVRELLQEHNLDAAAIRGTGPGGRIRQADVLDHVKNQPPAPAAPSPAPAATPMSTQVAGAAPSASPTAAAAAPQAPKKAAPKPVAGEGDTTIPLSKMRKLTGDHMVRSKSTSPHAFSMVEVDFANVEATRSRLKAGFRADEGFSLTYLPFVAYSLASALRDFPHLNASVGEDDLILHSKIELNIAVDLDHEGLIAPVIRSAETKRLRAIAREIVDLAGRARSRQLAPDEAQGGTFTISNNGSAGSVLSMPIINQPQVAIVSTDAVVRKPVVASTGTGEAIVVHPVGNLTMSWDHRAIDGAYAAEFLKRVKEILETRDWDAEL